MSDINSGLLLVGAELAVQAKDYSAMLEYSNKIAQFLPSPTLDPIDAMPVHRKAAKTLLCLAATLEKNRPYAFAAFGAANLAIPHLTHDPQAVIFGANIILDHIMILPLSAKEYSQTLDTTHAAVMEANHHHFQQHGKYSDALTALTSQVTGMVDNLGGKRPALMKSTPPLRSYKRSTYD